MRRGGGSSIGKKISGLLTFGPEAVLLGPSRRAERRNDGTRPVEPPSERTTGRIRRIGETGESGLDRRRGDAYNSVQSRRSLKIRSHRGMIVSQDETSRGRRTGGEGLAGRRPRAGRPPRGGGASRFGGPTPATAGEPDDAQVLHRIFIPEGNGEGRRAAAREGGSFGAPHF